MIRERFAPSPTGLIHLGHAFSALTAYDAARSVGGTFLLRIEDIDQARCRAAFEAQIFEDLRWLGVQWSEPVLRQSQRLMEYRSALMRLAEMGLVFPCNCTRGDIEAALSARQEGDGAPAPYPGTCRTRSMSDWVPGDAIRLNMSEAVKRRPKLHYSEIGSGEPRSVTLAPDMLEATHGDVVLARKDIQTSYNLAVVVDDAEQGVSHVTRGEDMVDLTGIHVLLQALLGYATPVYRHHRLIRDETGKRLAKRYDALSIKALRENGHSPGDIRRMVGL
ncbi:MAG: tRNA glutamyl-Q(34) synthetase GluQRS [Pseudomonadota bacterium]